MSQSKYKPKKVCQIETFDLLSRLVDAEDNLEDLSRAFNKALDAGWLFFVTDTQRGYTQYHTKVLTIPLWCIKEREADYWKYYLAHELAHTVAGYEAMHGPAFMQAFMSICPKHLQHYEIDYKPSNAMAAGITPSDF